MHRFCVSISRLRSCRLLFEQNLPSTSIATEIGRCRYASTEKQHLVRDMHYPPKPSFFQRPTTDRAEDIEFASSPSKITRADFAQLLEFLKSRRAVPTVFTSGLQSEREGRFKSILYLAPYWTVKFNMIDEFVRVCYDWFYSARDLFIFPVRRSEINFAMMNQARSLKNVNEATIFNLAYQLYFLGLINKHSEGRLMESLGWDAVSFMTRCMAECGLFTYSYEEICNVALVGLSNLLRVDMHSSSLDELRRHASPGVHLWLLSLEHYLAGADRKRSDFLTLTHQTGPIEHSIPSLFAKLDAIDSMVFGDYSASQPRLWRWLLLSHAKQFLEGEMFKQAEDSIERGLVSTELKIVRMGRFLNHCVPMFTESKVSRHRLAPEDLWINWYKATNVVLAQLPLLRKFTEEDKKNDPLYPTRLSAFKSMQVLVLLCNACQTAVEQQQSKNFFEIVFDNWASVLDDALPVFKNFTNEIATLAKNLLYLANDSDQSVTPQQKNECYSLASSCLQTLCVSSKDSSHQQHISKALLDINSDLMESFLQRADLDIKNAVTRLMNDEKQLNQND